MSVLNPDTAKTLIAYSMALAFFIVVVSDIFRVGYHPSWEVLAAILMGMFVMLGVDVSTNYFSTNTNSNNSEDE